MPYRVFNLEEVARYLHLTTEDVQQRVKHHEIPFEMKGERLLFRKKEIDLWASQRILGLSESRLAEYHHNSTHATRGDLPRPDILASMLELGAVDSAMKAKTKASMLHELVGLAEKTWQVSDPKELLASLEAREKLGTTAAPGGLALPHPRFHEPYLFEASFIVVGRPIQEIHFGAPDGRPTDLFFLLCCQDDRLHLLTLARLCLMACKTELLAELRQAPDALTMRESIIAAEKKILARQ
jgi:excisionase family DNA binding protein